MTTVRRSRPTSTTRDRGVVLPLTLVVAIVLGAIVVAVARYGTANLRYAQVTERRSDQLAAADAAMSYAVNLIKINRADCIYVSGAEVALPPLADSFNGATGSVTCEGIYGGLDSAGLFAVVITGEGFTGDYLINTQGGSLPKVFRGPVFMERVEPVTDVFDLANNAGIEIEGAPLLHYDGTSPTCQVVDEAILDDVDFAPEVFGPVCTPQRWFEYGEFNDVFDEPPVGILHTGGTFRPLSTLEPAGLPVRDGSTPITSPVTPSTWPVAMPVGGTGPDAAGIMTVEAAYEQVGTCRVFHPGRYVVPPDAVGEDAYFLSGDYVFEFRDPADTLPPTLFDLDQATAEVDAKFRVRQSRIVAGKLDTGEFSFAPTVTLNPDCNLLNHVTNDPGFGATFYMSGISHLEIETQGQMEIMPRDQGAPGDPEYVAIQALCQGQPSSWCVHGNPSSGTPDYFDLGSTLTAPSATDNPGIVYTQSGVNREMVVNGLIYAPLAEFELSNVTGSAQMRFRGGLVVARATLQASTSASNFEIGVNIQDVDIGFRLEATGTDTTGDSTKISSVVEYHFGDPYTTAVDVDSWRVCDASGC